MEENDKKNDNLLVIQKALEQELFNDVVTKLDLYEKKINEVLSDISDLQELVLLSHEESQKASFNLSQLEIDARIAKSLEEFGISKSENEDKKSGSFFTYILIAIVFLVVGYFIKY